MTCVEAHFINSALDPIKVCCEDGREELDNQAAIPWLDAAEAGNFY
jgi:hypothetical protein